jgi:RNA polymerase sigma factor (sigma-70 family)
MDTPAVLPPDAELCARFGPLARSIAVKYCACGVPIDDLVQEGLRGLLEARRRYDPDHGASFSTYAYFWMRKMILASLNREARQSLYATGLDDEREVPDHRTVSAALPDEMLPSAGCGDEERRILHMLFEEGKTLSETAVVLGITREQVRQRRQKALRRLRQARKLTEY